MSTSHNVRLCDECGRDPAQHFIVRRIGYLPPVIKTDSDDQSYLVIIRLCASCTDNLPTGNALHKMP